MADFIDQDAERALLAVIYEAGRVLGVEAGLKTLESAGVTGDDFTDSTHQAFLITMEGALRRGQALTDAVFPKTLKGFLPILQAQDVVSHAQLHTLSERLRELGTRRQLWEAHKRIGVAIQDEAVSVARLIAKFGEETKSITLRGSNWEPLDAALDEARVRIDQNQDDAGKHRVVPSGFRDLDDVTGGYQPTLVVIYGPGGASKTGLVLSSIKNILFRHESAALFAMEDGKASAAFRWLAHQAALSGFALKYRKLSDDAWNAVGRADGELRGLKLWIDGRPRLRPSEVLIAARDAIRRHNVGSIWLDNMSAMLWTRGARMDLEIFDFLTDARALATSEGVPFVVVAHTKTRDGWKPGDIPRLSECREAPGAFEILAREALGVGRDPSSSMMEIGVTKNTDGPVNVLVKLRFRESSALLEEQHE